MTGIVNIFKRLITSIAEGRKHLDCSVVSSSKVSKFCVYFMFTCVCIIVSCVCLYVLCVRNISANPLICFRVSHALMTFSRVFKQIRIYSKFFMCTPKFKLVVAHNALGRSSIMQLLLGLTIRTNCAFICIVSYLYLIYLIYVKHYRDVKFVRAFKYLEYVYVCLLWVVYGCGAFIYGDGSDDQYVSVISFSVGFIIYIVINEQYLVVLMQCFDAPSVTESANVSNVRNEQVPSLASVEELWGDVIPVRVRGISTRFVRWDNRRELIALHDSDLNFTEFAHDNAMLDTVNNMIYRAHYQPATILIHPNKLRHNSYANFDKVVVRVQGKTGKSKLVKGRNQNKGKVFNKLSGLFTSSVSRSYGLDAQDIENTDVATTKAKVMSDACHQKLKNEVYADKALLREEKKNAMDRFKNEFFFRDKTYKGQSLPLWMRKITYEQIPDLFGSLISHVAKPENPTLSKQCNDMIRQLASIRDNWLIDYDLQDILRELIYQIFTEMPQEIVMDKRNYKLPPRVEYCEHNALFMHLFKPKHFIVSIKKTKHGETEVPALLCKTFNEPSFLYNMFYDNISTSLVLTPKVLKSKMRTMLEAKKPIDDILDNIRSKMYVWTTKDVVNEELSRKLSWVTCYFPPEFYYYRVTDEEKFKSMIRDKIVAMRNNIMEFCRNFLNYSLYTNSQKSLLRQRVIDLFKNIKRTPRIQALYLCGQSENKINDYIYKHYQKEFIELRANNEFIDAFRIKQERISSKQIGQARAIKYGYDHEEVEVQCYIADKPINMNHLKVLSQYVYDKWCHLCCLGMFLVNAVFAAIVKFVTRCKQVYHSYVIYQYLKNPLGSAMPAIVEKRLLEMYTFMQIFISLHESDMRSVARWSGNFVITESKYIVAILLYIKNVNLNIVRAWFQKSDPIVTHCGVQYAMNFQIYQEYCAAYQAGMYGLCKEMIKNHAVPIVKTQSFSDVFNGISAIFSQHNMEHMDIFEIQKANTQFAYIKHWQQANKTKFDMVCSFISLVGRVFFSFDPFDAAHQHALKRVLEIKTFCDNTAASVVDFPKKRSLMREVCMMYEKSCILMNDPKTHELSPFLLSIYQKVHADLKLWHVKCSGLLLGSQRRAEPVFVLFTGPPGVGKTTTTEYLMTSLQAMIARDHNATCDVKDIMSPEFTADQLFTFNGTSEYWDGYCGQTFVILDDIWKQLDMTYRANESSNIIGIVNPAPYHLNMAAVEDKSSCFFVSPYVFASTNLANRGINQCALDVGMSDPGAIKRRLSLVLHREERGNAAGEIHKNTFRVDQCAVFPQLVGKWYNAVELARIIYELRKYQEKRAIDAAETPQSVLERVDSISDRLSAELGLNLEGVNVQSNPNGSDGTFAREPKKESPLPMDESVRLIQKLCRILAVEVAQETINTMYNIFLILLVLVILVKTSWVVYEHFFPEIVDDGELQSGPHKANVAYVRRRKQGELKKSYKRVNVYHEKDTLKPVNPQSASDAIVELQCELTNSVESRRKLSEGIVLLKLYSTNGGVSQSGMGFHIKDGYVCTAKHNFHRIEDFSTYVMRLDWFTGDGANRKQHSQVFPIPENMLQLDMQDLIIFRMPTNVCLPRSCYKYIQNDYSLVMPVNTPMYILTLTADCCSYSKSATKATMGRNMRYAAGGEDFIIAGTIDYVSRTVAGDSGAPICTYVNTTYKIIGMHIGVSATIGLGIPVSKELFDDMFTAFEPQCCTQMSFPLIPSHVVGPDRRNAIPRKSSFKRSRIFEWCGKATHVPAHLTEFSNSNGERINPLYKALTKMRQSNFAVVPYNEESVISYLMCAYQRDRPSYVLSFDEAINGSIERGIPGVCLSTSSGWPWKLDTTRKGKAGYLLLDDNTKRLTMTKEFEQDLLQKQKDLERGIMFDVVFADVLKDETRPIDKVNEGKTRLFSICPIDHLIFIRRYFLDFVTFVQRRCKTSYIAVGINPHSADWLYLYKRLDQKAVSILSGDYSNFDGNICKRVCLTALKFINKWYNDGPQNAAIRELLMSVVITSKHIVDDTIYVAEDNNPSGQAITSIWNSLVNIIYLYVVLSEDLSLRDDQFDMTVYGDDNVIAIDVPDITCETIAPFLSRRFGVTYTHFSKKEFHGVDTLSTIRYLGRKFVQDDSIIKAPLELPVIIECTYWFKGSEELSLTVALSTAVSFQIEISHHGREVFDTYVPLLRAELANAWPDVSFIDVFHSYDYYHEAMYNPKKHVFFTYGNFVHPRLEEDDLYYNAIIEQDSMKIAESKDDKFYEVILTPESNYTITNNNLSDRGINRLQDTETVELGAHQEAAPYTASNFYSAPLQALHTSTNMETFNLDNTMCREYLVASGQWTTTDDQDTSLYTVDFPDVLFGQTYIADKIANFAYFKSGIELIIKLSCNKFCSGALLVYFTPIKDFEGTLDTGAASVYYASGYPHMLISANQSESVSFRVPFISTRRAINTLNYSVGEMGSFSIRVLNPLSNINNEATAVQFDIMARFIDPQLFLPQDVNVESKVDQEGLLKSEHGVISSSLESMNVLAAHVSNVPVLRPYTTMFRRVTSSAGAMFKQLGLSKPNNVAITDTVRVSATIDLNQGKGIDKNAVAGMDPENRVSTQPFITGGEEDEMRISTLIGTPMLVNIRKVATITGSWFPVMNIGPDELNPSYVDNVCKCFKYHSGSYKYKAYIFSNSMIKARLVFFISSSTTGEDWPNCYHRIVDIEGDTEVEMTIPYVSRYFAEESNTNYFLMCKVLSLSKPYASVNSGFYINSYKAAASDFRVDVLKDFTFTLLEPQSNPRCDFSNSFEPLHSSFTGYEHDGVLFGERYETLREVVHRYSPIRVIPAAASQQKVYTAQGNVGTREYTGLEFWGLFYMFYRGSIRTRVFGKNNTPMIGTLTKNGVLYPGLMVNNSTVDPWVALTVPYFTNRLMLGTRYQGTTQPANDLAITYSKTGSAVKYMFTAAGDDFSFHYIVPLPPGAFNFVNTPLDQFTAYLDV